MIRHNDYKSEQRAMFQEAVELDLDRAVKGLLDGAERLSWTDCEMSESTLDRYIDTINAAMLKIRAARLRSGRAVRA